MLFTSFRLRHAWPRSLRALAGLLPFNGEDHGFLRSTSTMQLLYKRQEAILREGECKRPLLTDPNGMLLHIITIIKLSLFSAISRWQYVFNKPDPIPEALSSLLCFSEFSLHCGELKIAHTYHVGRNSSYQKLNPWLQCGRGGGGGGQIRN